MPRSRPAQDPIHPHRDPKTHAKCAVAHTWAGRGSGTLLALLLLPIFLSCGDDGPDPSPEEQAQAQNFAPHKGRELVTADGRVVDAVTHIPRNAPVPAAARAKIAEFLEAMVQPPLDETSDIHDAWFHRTTKMRIDLMQAGEHVGNAALHAFCGDASESYITRRALLMIGAHAAPKSAAPLLNELTFTYGYRIEDRTEACLLMSVADPVGYLARAEPFLTRRGRKSETLPDDEFLMRAWIDSCEATGRSPVEMCADVATNLFMDPMARYIAATELGQHTFNPLARRALETCLIESTGDGHLRRKAAQAIAAGYPREQACALFEDVLSKEVSSSVHKFLLDLIDHYCGVK
jgi:hypothetical protein